ncbi:hypothetical protein Tco_1307936, partial [Tanacetum coccineum]
MNSTWFKEKMLLVQAQEADNEITSDSNIIPYSQYLQESQQAVVQDTNSSAQQDSMIISMFEQMSEQMSNQVTNWNKANQETKTVNESLTAKLDRYKECVKTFEQRFNVDLNSREKIIDSQMDDMIWDRNALKQEIDSLKQTFSKHVNEKESLLQTFTVFKKETNEKERKNMDKEIELEKTIKELDNIVYKVGCPNCSLVFGLRMLQAYDWKSLSAHQLCSKIS